MPSYNDYLTYLQNPYVQAFLNTISWAEGAGYNTLYGGGSFSDYSRHPNRAIKAGSYTSTAAGRYQFLYGTWAGIANKLGLPDFSPMSQDVAALELINERGCLQYLLNGDILGVLKNLGCAWASLPYSGCGQGQKSLSSVLSYFSSHAGSAIDAGPINDLINNDEQGGNSDTVIVIAAAVLLAIILIRN